MPFMMDYSMELNGVFRYVTKLQNNESFMWIGFNNPKAGIAIRI